MTTFVSYPRTHAMHNYPIESAIIKATIGDQTCFPVDLSFIIDQVGADVRYAPCRNAHTHFRSSGPIINLSNVESNKERQRFIIAHELAHIMLRTSAAISLMERRGQTRLLDSEEELANRIAGTLLAPDSLIEKMKRKQIFPTSLWEIADQAGMPISMLITRMEESGIDIALLHWNRGKGTWYVVDRPGTPIFLHGQVEISALGRRALDHLDYGESEVTVDCRAKGKWMRIKGRSLRHGRQSGHVFQFLEPERDITFLVGNDFENFAA